MEVQCCFSCSVISKKLSSFGVIFPFLSKLHSCAHLRHAFMYWLLQYFRKCLRHFFKLCTTQNVWCFVWITSAAFLDSFCYLSQLLKNQVCIACKHDLFLLVEINSKVTGLQKHFSVCLTHTLAIIFFMIL